MMYHFISYIICKRQNIISCFYTFWRVPEYIMLWIQTSSHLEVCCWRTILWSIMTAAFWVKKYFQSFFSIFEGKCVGFFYLLLMDSWIVHWVVWHQSNNVTGENQFVSQLKTYVRVKTTKKWQTYCKAWACS